jgi:glutamate racemase
MVKSFAIEIAAFLERRGVNGIVVACNTASSAALPELEQMFRIPVWGVVEPGVEAACRATRTKSVGVLGTAGTIASGAYQHLLEQRGLQVWAQACPMFVHLVEEGLANSAEARALAELYLAQCPNIDTLILGCTHYPLLRSIIQQVVGDSVTLVDGASGIADLVERWFPSEAHPQAPGRIVHYVTGDSAAYRHTAAVIGDVDGEIIPLDLTRLEQSIPCPPQSTFAASSLADR